MKFPFKDNDDNTYWNAIITHVVKDKVQMALVDVNSQYQKMIEVDEKKLKWNQDNIEFIWDYEKLSTFREFYDMLKIFSLEYIINEWNDTLTDKDEYILDVECIFDQNYVDSDFEQFLLVFESKGISIECNYDDGNIRFTDIDGSVFEVRTTETENRYDSDITETIVFWDTMMEIK